MKDENISTHPKWGMVEDNLCYIDKFTTKLVIGTMPPLNVCAMKKDKISLDNFFYCSKDNWFWYIIGYLRENSKIKKVGLETKKEVKTKYLKDLQNFNENYIKDFCQEYKVGFCDIVKECYHNKNKAADEDLLSIDEIDLLKILNNYPHVKYLFCTSDYVITLLKIFYAKEFQYDKDKKVGTITFKNNKEYVLYHLSSPSGNSYRFSHKKKNFLDNYCKLLEIDHK